MSLYDDSNPTHVGYREHHRAAGDRIERAMKMKSEIRALRDCGVLRCSTPDEMERFDQLVAGNLATVVEGDGWNDYRLNKAGEAAAALL